VYFAHTILFSRNLGRVVRPGIYGHIVQCYISYLVYAQRLGTKMNFPNVLNLLMSTQHGDMLRVRVMIIGCFECLINYCLMFHRR
jgi:hypothetical protein